MSRQASILQRFVTEPRKFVLFNPTERPIKLMWHGETRTVPPSYSAQEPHPKYADVAHSASYEGEDTLIPGSLEISDVYQEDEQGQLVRVWDAEQAVVHWLGINTRTGTAVGGYAQRGLSLLSEAPTRQEVLDILRESRDRAMNWEVSSARLVIAEMDARNEARRRAGMPEIPGGNDYSQAIAILAAYNEQQREVARRVVAEYTAPVSVAPQKVAQVFAAAEAPEEEEVVIPEEDASGNEDVPEQIPLSLQDSGMLAAKAEALLNPPSLADKFHGQPKRR